jgi:hypothetical protein
MLFQTEGEKEINFQRELVVPFGSHTK